MPYFPKLNILYISIPSTGSDLLNRRLISHELFDGEEQDDIIYNNIIYKLPNVKSDDFKHIQCWEYLNKYPNSFDAHQFSVVRNPYDRVISIFFDLSSTSKHFYKFKPERNDSLKQLQDKFECFFNHFKMFKNFNQGIGIEHIEFLLRELKYPHEERMSLTFFKDSMFSDTRLSLQLEMIRTDFRNRLRFYGKKTTSDFNRTKIIKYENMKKDLPKLYNKIFSNLNYTRSSFKTKSGLDYPSNYFFNKKSHLLVAEFYEPDFYLFRYDTKIKLV